MPSQRQQKKPHPQSARAAAAAASAHDSQRSGLTVGVGPAHPSHQTVAATATHQPVTEQDRWGQISKDLKSEAGKVTWGASIKNVFSSKGNQSIYQNILHSMSLAHRSETPTERLSHVDTVNELIKQWHGSHGHDSDRGRALTNLNGKIHRELPNILQGIHAMPADKLTADDRDRASQLSATVHGRTSADGNIESQKLLGKGAMNSVYKTKFKGEQNPLVTKTADTRSDMGATNILGISSRRPEFARRNVATSRASEAFGFSVIPTTHFSSEKGQLGTAMDLAQGHSPFEATRSLIGTRPGEGAHWEAMWLGAQGKGDQAESRTMLAEHIEEQDIQRHEAGPNARAFSKQGVRYRAGKIDMHHPTTQRQLLQLQGLDFLTQAGEDRHGGNYFAAPSQRRTVDGHSVHSGGEIKGIDNDASWGISTADQTTEMAHRMGSKSLGLPPRLHEKDAQKFKAMTPEKLRASLGFTVNGQEFDAAIKRLNILKAHVDALQANGKILGDEDFGGQLYGQLEREHDSHEDGDRGLRSYIARDGKGIRSAAASRLQHLIRTRRSRKNLAAENERRAQRGEAPRHEPGRRMHQAVVDAIKNKEQAKGRDRASAAFTGADDPRLAGL